MLLFSCLLDFVEGCTDYAAVVVEKLADDVEVRSTPSIRTIHGIH